MRASDADREVVRTVLADAFADGRLTREEHEERVGTLLEARTLGELPGLVDDLVVLTPVPAVDGTHLPETLSFREQGAAAYRKELQEALATFLMVSLITWGIWAFTTAPDGHPWPIYPMLFLVVNLVGTGVRREAIVEREVHRLEKKAAKKTAKKAARAEIEAAPETAAPILDPPAERSEKDRPADPS
ncbi:DUF1707 domain-containing protein [Nocardioides sp. KC13]|uniref:DUF1707 domain-containing protein n=2 Tax=Nocardioides turkmenicus TaxID=2711220 RepID=A0A6M1QZV3_9ACTN|nr:DUF1707 domain-containing protein [Nocardioides sp. KC13]NGN95545.1 DUF1707 domain-containing protein [Nocardioides sp. KC13]